MPPNSNPNPDMPHTQPPIPLRILMLHGFTQTPDLFAAKTAALKKALSKTFPSPKYALHLSYPTAPHRLHLADLPTYNPAALDLPASAAPSAWGWWRRKDPAPSSPSPTPTTNSDDDPIYEGLEASLSALAACIRDQGPFDGVVGFSQGAALGVMLVSLLEGGRLGKEVFGGFAGSEDSSSPNTAAAAAAADDEHGTGMGSVLHANNDDDSKDEYALIQPALKFAVFYSGFVAPRGGRYEGFYRGGVGREGGTPVLCVRGEVDVVVDEGRGRALEEVVLGEGGGGGKGESGVVVHPGGHFVPCQRVWVDVVVGWIRGCVEGEGGGEGAGEKGKGGGKGEESVEDMDVPF